MSRMFWLGLLAVAAVVAGLWFAWRMGFVGEPALPGPLGALQSHLRAQGLDVQGTLVMRGASDGVRQHAMFRLGGARGRAFFVLWCSSEEAAQRQLQRLRAAPSPSLPQANGVLVVYLTDWPADDPLTKQVLTAFGGFDASSRPSERQSPS